MVSNGAALGWKALNKTKKQQDDEYPIFRIIDPNKQTLINFFVNLSRFILDTCDVHLDLFGNLKFSTMRFCAIKLHFFSSNYGYCKLQLLSHMQNYCC